MGLEVFSQKDQTIHSILNTVHSNASLVANWCTFVVEDEGKYTQTG